MDNLPAPTPPRPPTEVRSTDDAPSWRELRERVSDLMKELSETWKQESKELRREAAVKLLPAMKRAKVELEKLIQRTEERLAKEP